MKLIFQLLLFVLTVNLYSSDKPSIIYVHLGGLLPKHIFESMRQTRLHNPKEDIFLISNRDALSANSNELVIYNIRPIDVNEIQKSYEHINYLRNTPFHLTTQSFWIYTTERLLYIHDFMVEKNIQNVFHIENDVMVYGSFKELVPKLRKMYHSVAVPFANDAAAVNSLIYFKDVAASRRLADCISRHAAEGVNDMRAPGILKEELGSGAIDHLPILPRFYVDETDHSKFSSKWCPSVANKYNYCKFQQQLGCIFDAVTIGTLLSGHSYSICEGTIFDPRMLSFIWKINNNGLFVPYVRFRGVDAKIFNLHITHKNLEIFRSDGREPTAWIDGATPENGRYVH